MGKRAVHVTFVVLLAFLVVATFSLHAFTARMTPNVARIVGATLSQLALWAIGYRLCLTRPSVVLLALGIAAVVLARVTLPIVGWTVLLVLVAVRSAARRPPAAAGPGASG